MESTTNNLTWHEFSVSRSNRESMNMQNAKCIFLTGLSGSGKSTIANGLETYLINLGFHTYTLDGDNIRTGINNNLDFTPDGRKENLRRIAEISKLFVDAGIIIICSFIAPTEKDRDMIKDIVGEDDFLEVYVKASVETCINRDPKGLYAKALKGEIENFTGISAPYDIPKKPSYIVHTEQYNIEACVGNLANDLYPILNGRTNN